MTEALLVVLLLLSAAAIVVLVLRARNQRRRPARPGRVPGSVDQGGTEDAAAPTVADPGQAGGPARTVPGR